MTPYSTRKPISLFVVLLSLTAAGCDEGTAQNAPTVASSSTAANRVEIRGRLTAVDPPSRMVRVTDTAVLVPVGATIRRGATPLAFATLSVGDEVDIEAAVVGAILTATEVDVRTDNAGPGSIPDVEEVKGAVGSLTGTCPAIVFSIGSTRVAANASTVFDDGPCSGITKGTSVEVHGTRQSDGSLLARRIEREDDDDDEDDKDEVELEGNLTGRSGTCPSISFSLSGTPVVTNSSTEFKDGSCSSLANGQRVEVKGTRQGDGSVLARRVEKDD